MALTAQEGLPTAAPTRPAGSVPSLLRRSLAPVLGILLILPLLSVLGSAFADSGGVWGHLADTVLTRYLVNSVLLAGLVVAGTVGIGACCAWVVTLYEFPGRRILEVALLLPLAMPTYIIAYAATDFLDFAGPVQTAIRQLTGLGYGEYWFPAVRSLPGAVVVLSVVLYPYVYLLARAAFLEQSVCVLEASRTLGCSQRECFRRVGIPLARPALAAGGFLVAMESLAEFGAMQHFAVDTFTTGIYRARFSLGSPEGASQLAAVLLVFVILLLILERASRGNRRFFHSTNRYRAVPRWKVSGWRGGLLAGVVALPVLLGFVLPAAVLLSLALGGDGFGTQGRHFWEIAGNSFLLAVVTALLALGIALLVSYPVRFLGRPLDRWLARLVSLGYAIPGIVAAIGILAVLGVADRWLEGVVPFLLGGSIAALVYAYLVRFSSVALQSVGAGLEKVAPSLDEAGRSLGCSPGGVVRRVHLPLIRGTLLTATLLVFVEVLKELPATMIIRPFNFETLAVRTHHLASDERLAEAAIPALLIVAVGLIPVFVLSRLITASRAGSQSPAIQP